MANHRNEEEWNDEDEEWIDSPAINSRRTMDTYGYTGSYRFRPLSPWAYVGYTILFSIPVIGWLFLIVFTFSSSNINRRCFARSYWCFIFLIVSVVAIYFYVPMVAFFISSGNLGMTLEKANPFVFNIFDAGNSDNEIVKEEQDTFSSPYESTKEVPKISSSTARSKAGALSAGVTREFKEAMDSYESFFNKYVEFMKKSERTNGDLSALADYASFMTQYADMMQKIDAIDDKQLSVADSAYYLEVTSRIYKKLSEVSSQ